MTRRPGPTDPQDAPGGFRSLLRELGCSWAKTASATVLGGGITNRNWLVEAPDGTYVLRQGGRGARLLGIDRRRERAAAEEAFRRGVGPQVVAARPERALLLTRFARGVTLEPQYTALPGVFARVARSLRRFHSGRAIPGRFNPFRTVERYARLASGRGARRLPDLDKALDVLRRVEAAAGPAPRLAPCHNDLLAGNIIDNGLVVRLIDWEYAAMGDPMFDLGNLAANLDLGPGARRSLLTLYLECREGPGAGPSLGALEDFFGASAARRESGSSRREGAARRVSGGRRGGLLARLELMRLASDMRESLWGHIQSTASDIDFDFRGYALRHLRRFLKRAFEPAARRLWEGSR